MAKNPITRVGSLLTLLLLLGLVVLVTGCADSFAVGPASPGSATFTAPQEEVAADTTLAGENDVVTSEEPAAGVGTEYTATATSYVSATTAVTISTVTTGSGKSALTYYVADVQLTSGTDLQSAFARGWQRGNVDTTSSIAGQNGAIVAVNGDYCGARDTGVIIRNGELYLDNPTRDGLAIYQDGTMRVYDETEVSTDELLAAGVWNTFSFGPALLVDGVIPEDLDQTEVEDIGEKHTILGNQPRTAVGMVDTNHFVLVVVDGRSAGYSMGVTLSGLAHIFRDLGCTIAYNLDGGGSSAMYFMGKLVNDPLGEGKERGISDILLVG